MRVRGTHPRSSTSITALGSCARISGEYIASTRVAGRLNLPEALSRITYEIVKLPRGTQP